MDMRHAKSVMTRKVKLLVDIRVLKLILHIFAYVIVLIWPVLFLGALLARFICRIFGIETEFD